MIKKIIISTLLFLSIAVHSIFAQQEKTSFKLSPKLQKTLKGEMNSLTDYMQELIIAIPAGDWATIQQLGDKIQNSYIRKQKLSKVEMEELHHALPEEFIEMDSQFHTHASMLAHVAKERQTELVTFYFYKLMDGCVNCHATYANATFSGFKKLQKEKHHE